MMRKTRLAVAILASSLSSASQAQNVKVNDQDFSICASPSSTFGGWVALAAGRACSTGRLGERSGTVDWTFIHGPLEFYGLDFSGSLTFFPKQKLNGPNGNGPGGNGPNGNGPNGNGPGGNGPNGNGPNGNGPNDNGPNGNGPNGNGPNGNGPNGNGPNGNGPNGNGPNGNGPDGNGPPGNGPRGNGPPGNGPDGNGPPGNGPDGNGPPGPPDNHGSNNGDVITNNVDDDLDDLVNHTNATPEPATLLLVASGLGGVGALARRRSKRRNDEA